MNCLLLGEGILMARDGMARDGLYSFQPGTPQSLKDCLRKLLLQPRKLLEESGKFLAQPPKLIARVQSFIS